MTTRHIRRTQDDEVKRLRLIAGTSKFAAIIHDKTPTELFSYLRDHYYASEITQMCQIYNIENYTRSNHKLDRIRFIIDWLNEFGLINTPERTQNFSAHEKDREEAREWLIPFDAKDNFKDFLENGEWPHDMISCARDLAAKLSAFSEEHNGVGLKLFDRSTNECVVKLSHVDKICISYFDKHSINELITILQSFGMHKILLDEFSEATYPTIPAAHAIAKIIIAFLNRFDSQPEPATAEALPPDNLYMDESYSDTPGDNSRPDDDIPECHTPDSFSGNPGLTVIHSEHISRPDYRQTHDTPIDDCPCVNVTACYSPAHSPAAAIVPYSQAASIRNFLHIISIYLRMWVALHISRPVLRFEDFPDGIFTHCTTRKKPRAKFRRAEFEVGSSYSATCYSPTKGLQSFTFLVTGRCVYEDTYDKTKGVMLFVTCNSPEDHAFEGRGILRCIHTEHGVEYYEHRKGYEMGYGDIVFTFRADKRDNVPFPFKDTTPSEPNYKPCGDCTRFISRDFLNYSDNPAAVLQPLKFASDIKEVNKIRRENKTMIDACDSEEKIAALMLSLNKKDILNQADYCRVSLVNAHVKSDTQLAREFAAAIMKRRQKKTRKTKPATAHDEKLINLDGLHENERRNARNHNIALLSACMFPEAVISLLMGATVHTVKALGLHLGYMCKTVKGEKKFLAEKFAAEMFRIRNRKKPVAPSSVQTAKQPPHVPDGVKFEVNKKRQICFSFTE